jgi:Family of unknown function (DUF6502)
MLLGKIKYVGYYPTVAGPVNTIRAHRHDKLGAMNNQPTLVLARVLRVLQPLVRLLVRNGVTYPVLAAALKRLFLDAARSELAARGMAQTDSAVSVLCGVHRRDVRTLAQASATTAADPVPATGPLGMAAQVVGRWMRDAQWHNAQGQPLALPRAAADTASFDALVASVSSDVRPRAVLDELLRLGVVQDDGAVIRLSRGGFAPTQGFEEMSALLAANLHDHAAAAVANLHGEGNFLEQAVFVDQLTAESALHLHTVSAQVWRQALKTVMSEAQSRFDADSAAPLVPGQPRHRARVGIYFYSERED